MTDTVPPTDRAPLSDARQAIVDYAKTLDGLSADPADPEACSAYIELVAPGETGPRVWELIADSDCGLVAAGIWRECLGRCPDSLEPPYKTQMALVNLRTAALAAGAVHSAHEVASGAYIIQPGDLVHVGRNGAACEHVYTRLDERHSIDGGQRDGMRFEDIAIKERWLEGTTDVLANGTRRPLLEVYDWEALAAYYA